MLVKDMSKKAGFAINHPQSVGKHRDRDLLGDLWKITEGACSFHENHSLSGALIAPCSSGKRDRTGGNERGEQDLSEVLVGESDHVHHGLILEATPE